MRQRKMNRKGQLEEHKTNKARKMHSRSKKQQRLKKLQEEIKLLQIYNEKLNGDDLCGLSYTELQELESLLQQGMASVSGEIEKAEEGRQFAEGDLMGLEWVERVDKEDFSYQALLLRRRRALRLKAREVRLSPRDSQLEQEDSNSDIVMSVIESLKREKERLRLWNQRMIGEELDGMGYHELTMFHIEIGCGLTKVWQEKTRMRRTNGTSPGQIRPPSPKSREDQ